MKPTPNYWGKSDIFSNRGKCFIPQHQDEFTESHWLYSSILIIKELELGEPPPPYALTFIYAKKIHPNIKQQVNKQKEPQLLNKDANLCNFRRISSTIGASQAHF